MNITWEELFVMSKEELKKRVRLYDTDLWEQNLVNKSTLKYYAEGKTGIGYEHCYRNNANSTYLARARTNSLRLEEAKGRGNPHHSKECKMCGQGEENIVHFLVECKALEGKRNYNLLNWYIEDPKKRMIELLFRQEDYQGVGKMVRELWFRRKAILRYKEEEEQKSKNSRSTPNELCRSNPGPRRKYQAPIRWRSRGNSVNRG